MLCIILIVNIINIYNISAQHLTKTRNLENLHTATIIVGATEIAFGSLNLMLDYSDCGSDRCEKIKIFLFTYKIASSSEGFALQPALKRSAAEAITVIENDAEIPVKDKVWILQDLKKITALFIEVTVDIVQQQLPLDFFNSLIRVGKSEQEILEYFVDYHNNYNFRFFNEIKKLVYKYPDLTLSEVCAIWGYTTNFFYRKLNKSLRSGEDSGKIEAIKNILNSALSKVSKYNGIAYRAIEIHGDNLVSFLSYHSKIGQEIVYKSYLSGGNLPEASFFNRSTRNIRLILEVKDAPDISDFSDGVKFRGYKPKELLIPIGSIFIVDNYKSVNDIHYINLRQID